MKRLLLLAAVAMLGQGCLSAGIYRTGRTLEPGRGDLSLTWNTTQVSTSDYVIEDQNGDPQTVEGASLTLPNVIPELGYHLGVANNFEMGGRISPGTGYIEIDGKVRVVHSEDDRLHMALAPAVGYNALLLINGVTATLPFIVTYDALPNLSLNVAPYVAYQSWNVADNSSDINFFGTYVNVGGSVGVQVKGRKFYFMPTLDIARNVSNFNSQAAEFVTFPTQTYIRFGISIGWISGQELESLDRIEDKLDKALEEKEKKDEEGESDEDDQPDDEDTPSL